MSNQIICGDCVTEMNNLPGEIARLVIADPPYYNVLLKEHWDTAWECEQDYLTWTSQWLRAAMRVLKPGGLLYCFGQLGKREHVMLHLMSQAAHEYSFHDMIIWDRVVGYNDRRDSFTPAYEMILVLRKEGEVYFDKNAVREPYDQSTITQYARDKRYKNADARMEHLKKGKYATNLWRIPSLKGSSKEKVGHPSQKPKALIERIIRSSSEPGDLVVDPFLGSGTTAVVSHKLKRECLGIEVLQEYVALAKERLQKASDSHNSQTVMFGGLNDHSSD
ncbi:site-specific DNA-methyltransferase (adenine-specific) [Abditibacterium utsteinense]|uniref:Methyltransferase n=1 Tax=Abditibacterium utsteinense TaxID=1960156 RepID=A0A2S8SVL0_9BACT|nr:site-specific DNA-methyltransferase [Abditibacterium utsteinense]PQV64814.1 site-specific DNA-methyltransferase (adenine-specific) [Abditibacterium utsteinense]